MPSQIISDINPNSLGPLQPIRAPQVPISIPNPLSVAPFFQGQQLQQNERRLDQQDLAMVLQEKQMDFAKSQLLFQQTKELLDMGDLAINDLYKEHTSRQSQAGGGSPLQLGLDPTYAGHRKVMERANAQIGDFQTKIANAARGALNGGDSKAINQLLVDTKTGLSQARTSLQNDKEYMMYAVQQQKFNKFMDRIAQAQKDGKSVDWQEVQRVKGLYDAFANGEDLDLQTQGLLGRQLSDAFLQDITFDKDQGYKAFQAITKAATAGQKSAGYNANIPGAPGYVAAEVYETFDDPNMVMNNIITAAGADTDILKMFKAATGLNPMEDQNKEAFARWVGVQAKPYIQDGGTRVTEVGREIYDPTEVLKAKASAATTGGDGSRFGKTEAGIRAQLTADDFSREGLEVISGGDKGILDYSQMKRGSTTREVDPNTGEVKIYQVKVDSDGNPVMEPDYDAKNKVIPGTEKMVKIGEPILILGKRTTTAPSAGDDLGSQNNNPGNIRATPEQIRRGTVKVDNKGFIVFDTIEQGLEASAADNEAKISGKSQAMRNSPYMVTKYGKDNLANYPEFATVEDLINVRTPRETQGGDNTNAAVDGFLVHLENRGFPKDLKLTALDPAEKAVLNKAIVEYESPSSYARLFNPKPVPENTATTPVTATSPQQVQAQVTAEDSSLSPAIKTVQEAFLRGENPSPAKLMEYINDAGLITPDRETTSPSKVAKIAGITKSGPSMISKANETLQRAENDLRVIESKIKEDSKASQRQGKGVIVKEDDPRYIKAANAVNTALESRNNLAETFASEAEAILKAEAFPTEAVESYKSAAEFLQSAIGSTTKFDLDLINPDLEGSIIEYEDEPGVFSLQEKGKKERDITLAELADWIGENAKTFAFTQTDPVELRRAKLTKAQTTTQSTTPTTSTSPVPQTNGAVTGSATGKKY